MGINTGVTDLLDFYFPTPNGIGILPVGSHLAFTAAGTEQFPTLTQPVPSFHTDKMNLVVTFVATRKLLFRPNRAEVVSGIVGAFF